MNRMQTLFDRFLEVYRQVAVTFGAADICFDDSSDVAAVAGSFVLLMNQAKFAENANQVRRVIVIAPPHQSNLNCDQAAIEAGTVKAAEEKFGRNLSRKEITAIGKFVVVSHAKDFHVDSATQLLREAPADSAVIILHAALYRSERSEAMDLPSPALPEDLWVPHLVYLAEQAVTAAQSASCYVLIDVGETRPYRPGNQSRINSIADCGVFGWDRAHDGAKLVAENLERWEELIKSGRLGSAFASIEALPDWMDSEKPFLKLQLTERVLPGEHVLQLIRDFPEMKVGSTPSSRLKVAKIASRSHDDETALEVLSSTIGAISSEEDFGIAADLALRLGQLDLLRQILARSEALFPQSADLLDYKLTLLLKLREYSELLSLVSDPPAVIYPERKFVYATLAAGLNSAGSPDYQLILSVIASAAPKYNDRARISCSNEALARRDYTSAIEVCIPGGGRPLTKGVANALITAIRHRLLERAPDGRNLVVSGDELVPPVIAAIRYLSANPTDGTIRQRLTSLLAPETSGMMGFAILISIAHQLASKTELKERTTEATSHTEGQPTSMEEIMEATRKVFEWIARESPVLPGFTILPKDLIEVPVDDLFAAAEHMVKSEEDLRQTLGAEMFDKWFTVAMLLAPHIPEPNKDLDLVRFAGARYVAVNKSQRARDLAEHALHITHGVPERQRLAWYAFADIYDRTKSFNEALLGISCALAVPVPIDFDQLYYEATLLVRIYRDIHFSQHAMELVRWIFQMCEDLALGDKYKLRLTTLELQIRVLDAHRHAANASELFQQLTTELGNHCRDLEKAGDDTAPATLFLAHCIQYCSSRGIAIDGGAKRVFEENLVKIPAATAAMIRISDPTSARGADLLEVARSIEMARNAEDIAFDLMTFAIACRRFLDSGIDGDNVESAAFAIEALSDHALKESLVGTKDSPFESLGRSLAMAKEIAERGLNVVMLGLSERGTLVRLNIADQTTTLIRESAETFSEKRFAEWSDRYPYRYANVQNPMNLFYLTLTGIGLSDFTAGPTVLVMDNSLQQMPPNLIMMGNDFAGRQVPMASAPSLSWLWAAQRRGRQTGKRIAWISTEFAEHRNPALITLAERLQETFDRYEIPLRTAAEVPNDLAESELVIIAAHGSILPEGRYVQRISDDAELALYPSVLASAVRKSAVVILFICSGGRLDTHPSAETTVGLVRQLLDDGCATVIAAPWPLDTRVPSHWLPAFLKLWTAGKSAIEATYDANQEVAHQMGDLPLDSLAMNVFGDPMRMHNKQTPTAE
jgi:hypothetical protein